MVIEGSQEGQSSGADLIGLATGEGLVTEDLGIEVRVLDLVREDQTLLIEKTGQVIQKQDQEDLVEDKTLQDLETGKIPDLVREDLDGVILVR